MNTVNSMNMDRFDQFYNPAFLLTQPPALQAAAIHEEANWCTVSYYEMNNRIGTPFIGIKI